MKHERDASRTGLAHHGVANSSDATDTPYSPGVQHQQSHQLPESIMHGEHSESVSLYTQFDDTLHHHHHHHHDPQPEWYPPADMLTDDGQCHYQCQTTQQIATHLHYPQRVPHQDPQQQQQHPQNQQQVVIFQHPVLQQLYEHQPQWWLLYHQRYPPQFPNAQPSQSTQQQQQCQQQQQLPVVVPGSIDIKIASRPPGPSSISIIPANPEHIIDAVIQELESLPEPTVELLQSALCKYNGPGPIPLDGYPYADRLSLIDYEIASTMRIGPEQYIAYKYKIVTKAQLLATSGSMYRIKQAQFDCGGDGTKIGLLVKVFSELGWITNYASPSNTKSCSRRVR
ncbi:hypothetical protein GQ42DRAFT_171031 [Ramicandelaber brevisporus]|nr:hypothetical protein GQ42DRAFT_171031 [Ramicandelaber brevisporus]